MLFKSKSNKVLTFLVDILDYLIIEYKTEGIGKDKIDVLESVKADLKKELCSRENTTAKSSKSKRRRLTKLTK